MLKVIDSLRAREAQPDPEPVSTIAPPAAQVLPEPRRQDVSMFDPLPNASRAPVMGDFDPATSAIVLPRADDRELAMRLRGPLGGIASLA